MAPGADRERTMLVSLDDAAATGDLSEFLRSSFGAIVDRREPRELEVSMVGSFSDAALREQIEFAVRRWSFVRHRLDAPVVG